MIASGTTCTPYQFREAPCKGTGQRNETSLGLYFYNARWYDPSLARFTSADTLVPAGVQGYDRYAYANNNPVKYVDPSGHNWEDCGNRNGYQCRIHMRRVQRAKDRWTVEAAAENNDLNSDTDIITSGVEAETNQGCSNPNYCESGLDEIVKKDDDTTQTPPPPELSFAQKAGMVVTAILFDVVITIIELQIAALMVEAAVAGPLGIDLDVAVLLPVELFLIDLEIGVSTYVYDVVTTGTKEGNEMEFHIIIPLLKDLVNSN